MVKNKTKSVFLIFMVAIMLLTSSVYAVEIKADISQDFIDWANSEEAAFTMPRAYTTNVVAEEEEPVETTAKSALVSGLLKRSGMPNFTIVGASPSDAKYNLKDHLNLRVENQGSTSECWAFSTLKSMETNIAKRTGTRDLLNFSERHIDYATSKTFKDGTNPIAYDREIGGGLPLVALGYLTNGTGAVLESDMPFEDNQNKIYLSELNKPVDTVVTDYATLPIINKKYQKNTAGNTVSVTYQDSNKNTYTDAQVKAIRNTIKKHIINDGAIFSFTAGNKSIYYNIDQSNPTASVFTATNYNCNNEYVTRDHAVTIVGWDDNYSKDNFVEGHKPSSNGAYIVLNSYGEESFDNGYLYISYEDCFIESECYCVTNTHKKDYDNIYQSDFYGGVYAIGTDELSTGYFGHTFTRNTSNKEYLHDVGITLADEAKVEIYINTDGDSMNLSKLTKIGGSSSFLEPGYHRIKVQETTLNNPKYTIVVKQIEQGDGARFYFTVETPVKSTVFSKATSDGPNAYSEDGYDWTYFDKLSITGMDMSKTDVCIKAFTSYTSSTDNPPTPTKEVTGVTITPATAELYAGDTAQFTARVTGNNLTQADMGVNYSVIGQKSSSTHVDANGKLYVGSDEQPGTLKVYAESQFDPQKTAVAIVTVLKKQQEPDPPAPEKKVTGITINPVNVSLKPGESKTYTVKVTGENLTSEDLGVNLRVVDNTSSNTKITENGVLTLGQDEKAKTIKVVATSKFDSSKSAVAYVTVVIDEPEPPAPEKKVTGITISPLSISLKPGESRSYTVKITGENLTTEDIGVSFKVVDNTSSNTKITDNGVLTLGQDEKAKTIKVVATSKFDSSKSAVAYVTVIVDEPEPQPDFSSNTYKITNSEIYKIQEETKLLDFKKNVNSNLSYNIYKDNVIVQDDNQIMQTGMKLRLKNGKEYMIVVRGDINLDGKVTLVDLSKQILHFNETKGFILSGAAVKGADMNYDGEVTLLDISQMLVYFNSK